MKGIYSIDDAIKKIENKAKSIEKPVFVGVFSSCSNAGKSYFIKKSIDYFHEKIKKEKQELEKEKPITYVACSHKEDYLLNSTIKRDYENLEFIFFHCGINSYQPSKSNIKYWNRQMKKEMKKYKEIKFGKKLKTKLDISVVIYNPKIFIPDLRILLRDFDIVIKNDY